MKIRIESVSSGWVEFSCSLGRGEAKWNGAPPEFGHDYHVELELADPIEVKPAAAQVPLLDATRERCLVRGQVESVVAGVSRLRIGEAHLDLVGAFSGWLAVRSDALTLFDENL